jgi:hypothetical protein
MGQQGDACRYAAHPHGHGRAIQDEAPNTRCGFQVPLNTWAAP